MFSLQEDGFTNEDLLDVEGNVSVYKSHVDLLALFKSYSLPFNM